jgi:hypothetical protein
MTMQRLIRSARAPAITIVAAALTLLTAACGSDDSAPDPVGQKAAATRSVDADVEGEALPLGERIVAPFVDYGGREQPTKVGVRVLGVRKGRIGDLKDFNLDRKQRRSVPYYIDAEFENLGGFTLTRHLLRPSVEDGTGREYRPATLIVVGGTFKPCPQGRETKLRPGGSFTGCSAVLLPKGSEPNRVRFQGDVTKDPLFWQPQ